MTAAGLFRREPFVLWLIQRSERARTQLSAHLGVSDENEQLLKMWAAGAPAELAVRLDCQPDEAFVVLAEQLAETFEEPLEHFTLEHLNLLAQRRYWVDLGLALGWDTSGDVLGELLDAEQIRRTLRSAGVRQPPGSSWTTAGGLLIEVLGHFMNVSASLGYEAAEFGECLLREHWLRDSAREALDELAGIQGWHSDDPTRILATLLYRLRDARAQSVLRSGRAEVRFDALATLYLRLRLQDVIEDLRNGAVQHATAAAEHAPQFAAIRALPVSLEYEAGSVSSALSHLVSDRDSFFRIPLRAFLPNDSFQIVPCSEEPDVSQPFVVRDARVAPGQQASRGLLSKLFGAMGRGSEQTTATGQMAFAVACHMRDARQPRDILTCTGLSQEDGEYLQTELQKYSAGDLGFADSELGARLLRLRIRVTSERRRLLTAGLSAIQADVARCLVLYGIRISAHTGAPWDHELSDSLPYKATFGDESSAEIELPVDLEGIVADIATRYQREGLRIERLGASLT